MTGAVALLNGCLASGACVDITVRDGVIHETGDTEATSGAPESDGENAAGRSINVRVCYRLIMFVNDY